MLKLEIAMDGVTADLYGRSGTNEPGLVRQYSEDRAEKRGQYKVFLALGAFVAAVNAAMGVVFILVELKIVR